VCVVEEAKARCLCAEGFLPRPSGACEPVTPSNCPSHGGDTAEPDECMASARPLPVAASGSTVRTQSVSPVGDQDFFAVEVQARRIYEAQARTVNGTLAPRVDLFDVGGVSVDWSEDPAQAVLRFKAAAAGRHYLRVGHSPLDPTVGTGDYTLTLVDRGVEDHGDVREQATPIVADRESGSDVVVHAGAFEVAGDSDWFRFTADSSRRYALRFDGSRGRPAVRVIAPDGRATGWEPGGALSLPSSGEAFLELRPSGDASQPPEYAFTLTFTDV
jgi:hypothetical protein